jgi:hypothetical protein
MEHRAAKPTNNKSKTPKHIPPKNANNKANQYMLQQRQNKNQKNTPLEFSSLT